MNLSGFSFIAAAVLLPPPITAFRVGLGFLGITSILHHSNYKSKTLMHLDGCAINFMNLLAITRNPPLSVVFCLCDWMPLRKTLHVTNIIRVISHSGSFTDAALGIGHVTIIVNVSEWSIPSRWLWHITSSIWAYRGGLKFLHND